MKKILALILAIFMVVLPLVACETSGDVESDTKETDAPETEQTVFNDEELYVGYGRESITPVDENRVLQKGIKLTGYEFARDAQNVLNDMLASCTAVKDKDGEIALIYTLDLHAMTIEFATALRRNIKKELGIPENNVILNVTHTHAVPHTDDIKELVSEKVIAAGKAAIEDLTLVTELYTGVIEIDNMNFVRRYNTDDNGKPISHCWENTDANMPVVKFVREGEKQDVILANWAAHCDTVIGNNPNSISADYVSYFRKRIETELGALVSFQLGAAGDMNPVGKLEGEPQEATTILYGRELADHLIAGLDSLKRREIKSNVESKIEEALVYYDKSEGEERGKQAIEIWKVRNAAGGTNEEVEALLDEYGFASVYEMMYARARYLGPVRERLSVGAISIGNVVFAVAPYEMFSVNASTIKASADEFDLAFICAYSNGMLGYIASEEAFNHDIYEVHSRLYVKETATVLQDTIISTIDELGK